MKDTFVHHCGLWDTLYAERLAQVAALKTLCCQGELAMILVATISGITSFI